MQGLEPVRKRPGMYIGSTGREGLHHLIWECFDNSVTHDTPAIVREDGCIKVRKMGELIDGYFRQNPEHKEKAHRNEAEILRNGFQLETLSFDPQTLKLQFRPVFSMIRHKVNSEIYRVTLQNGRQVEITPYHSLFSLQRGKVTAIKGADLEVGTPIVVPKTWPEPEKELEGIDLIDKLMALPAEKTESIFLFNVKDLLSRDIYRQLTPRLKGMARGSLTPANLFCDYRRYDYLPFNLLRQLGPKEIGPFKKKALLGTRYNRKFSLSPFLKIDGGLVELLGLFAAEGCLVKSDKRCFNRVSFSFGAHEKELIEYTRNLLRVVLGVERQAEYVHETARTISINSYLLALVFGEVLGTGHRGSGKKVPDVVFNLNASLRERYLIAYLSGDGYPTRQWIYHLVSQNAPAKGERKKFSFNTTSHDLSVGLTYLLASLGKSFSQRKIKKAESREMASICYRGRVRKGRPVNCKTVFGADFYWHTQGSYFNRLPFDEVIKECQDGPALSASRHGRGISSDKALALLEANKLTLEQGVLDFIGSDLGVLRVRSIEKVKYSHPWVYDFSVLGHENFVAGYAPICVHNSLDEAMAGHASEIRIDLLPDNKVRVSDNGRGIPVDKHAQTKKSALETVMTTLHAGGKFGGKAYRVSGGLHGVGVSVVCALADYLKAEVCRDGYLYTQEYSRGKATSPMKKAGKCEQRGTAITFSPDPEIFKDIEYSWEAVLRHLRQQAYLTKGVKIVLSDRRGEGHPRYYSFCFTGGLRSYAKYLVADAPVRHDDIFHVSAQEGDIHVELALQYIDETEVQEESFANNIYTQEGGMHLTGFRTALTRVLNNYARANDLLKKEDENLSGLATREGLVSVVSVKLPNPQFEGQTKAKLGNPEVKTAVEKVLGFHFQDFLERNPRQAKSIIEGCFLSARAHQAARIAREMVLEKRSVRGMSLPGKLADCISRKPEESELFIVEGESAGGSAKQARDRNFQAILPLKGKILNVERVRLNRVLSSDEIKALIIALGTAIADDFDLEKLRYHRVIIMSDADVDGAHIRTLLLTLFYRYFKPVIDQGHLYIAQPPLYQIKKDKKIHYAYTEKEKEEVLKKIGEGSSIQRYKGLGEMNPNQLWETTMDPEGRILLQVTVGDAAQADRVFDNLMGKEVILRKKFIQSQAHKVKNLDI